MARDYRTSAQAEDLADRLMDQADSSVHNPETAQRLRDQAIYAMLRAILLALRKR